MKPSFLTALPVFNEQAHIVGVLQTVRHYSPHILVVDDGSTDRTPQLLHQLDFIDVVQHPSNQGYGAALKTAFDYAVAQGYDILVTMDCDGQHEPSLIRQIVSCVFPKDDEPVDIVSGSRYLSESSDESVAPRDRRAINREITALLNRRLNLKLTDAFCGFKAYRTMALEKLDITEPGYGMPLQLWAQAACLGLRVVEFPVPLIYLEEKRSFGGSLDDATRRRAYYRQVLDRELPCAQKDIRTGEATRDRIASNEWA